MIADRNDWYHLAGPKDGIGPVNYAFRFLPEPPEAPHAPTS